MNTAPCTSKMTDKRLVAFDLDGVLVKGTGSWSEIHKVLGTDKISAGHGVDFQNGKISFDEWAKKDTELWKGVELEKIKKILYKTRLMKGAGDTINALKSLNYDTIIISGGLQILADRIRDELGMDYAIANRLLFNNNQVCGIEQRVDFEGKGRILEKIINEKRIDKKDTVAVGDYINDIPLFKAAGFSVAFNPKDDRLLKYADAIILDEDLTKILPLLENSR
ncbi:MAG: phosphoserine phosphatase [Candidatus Altiarchaeales archaeon ex4484_96]|nr:MAG: phosphoserine phosphatase [Candidatus Altiarchaeales archaeon ex4484_96]